jgi:hypothetical protein
VKLRVLAGRVARGINEGRVQADSLLWGPSAISTISGAVILTTSPASPMGILWVERLGTEVNRG